MAEERVDGYIFVKERGWSVDLDWWFCCVVVGGVGEWLL